MGDILALPNTAEYLCPLLNISHKCQSKPIITNHNHFNGRHSKYAKNIKFANFNSRSNGCLKCH